MSSNQANGPVHSVSVSRRPEEASALLESAETLADYVSKCAQLEPQVPVLAFPRHEDRYGDFEKFTARDINDLADRAAMVLIRQGLAQLGEEKSVTITLLGQGSSLYVATLLALAKLGYTVFLMSPRLSAPTIVALLAKMESSLVVFTGNIEGKMGEVRALRDVKALPMVRRVELDFGGAVFQPSNYETKTWTHGSKVGLIWHSSGSTGTPKVFPLTQSNIMARLRSAVKTPYFGKPLFITSSVYNSAGSTFLLLGLCNSETTYYYNDFLPYTAEGLTTVMVEARPHTVVIVPYALGQLASSSVGLEALKGCRSVNAFGAVCPTELGDKLVGEGVSLNSGYAMSETGTLMNSTFRDASTDKAWDYLAPYPNVKEYICMKPLSDDLYECVILPGLASCPISNSDDPPGSFHTGDVFVPHATLPGRWRPIGRRDDVINMSFSASFVALPFEDRVRSHPLVAEAVMFGNGRPTLGVLVFASEAARHLGPREVADGVWAVVEELNAQNEAWTRVEREMVVVVEHGRGWPKTDKQNVIRPAVYKEFESVIDALYKEVDKKGDAEPHGES